MTSDAFAPADHGVVTLASDGTLAAVREPTRISIVGLPDGVLHAEVGIDLEASAVEARWLGTPPRLLVLSRYAAHSTLHLLDPHGPRTLAEIRLEAPMRLVAAVGAHALAIGALGAAVVTAGDAHLTPYQFPARAVPVAAGAAGPQFVVALAAAIEEWDPQIRMPKRRLRLPKPAVITAVGGSERILWMTSQADPTRIDCLPLVNRGQPKGHDLPEPIAQVAAHPRSDLLACLGADSGKVYLIDLDGRARMRTLAFDGIARADSVALVVARTTTVVVSAVGRPLGVLAVSARDSEADAPLGPAASVFAPIADEPAPDEQPRHSTLFDPPPPTAPAPALAPANPFAPPAAAPATALAVPAPVQMSELPRGRAPVVTTTAPAPSLTERFSAWRDRMRDAKPRGEATAVAAWMDPGPSWRDELALWTRGVISGSVERNAPVAPPIELMIERFDLPVALAPALALLYGAHLCGEPGIAPVELARVLARNWDEALGNGQLAARGVAIYEHSRVRLAPGVQRALDERPPRTGMLVGEVNGPVALLGPCVVVGGAPTTGTAAAHLLPTVGGAILAGDPDASPAELFVEARAFGAVPLLFAPTGTTEALPADPAILVVRDDAAADALGLPRLT